MTTKIEIGNSQTELFKVSSADLISEIDSSLPNVLGTYQIVKWAEITSGKILYNVLPTDKLSVGMKIEIKHSGISLEGAEIQVKSTVTSVKGPMVNFDIEVFEGEESIAKLSHIRVILSKEKLQDKINQKLQQ